MPRPFVQLGNAKIAPFKYGDNPPYGAFINTTKAGEYPVAQNVMIDGKPVTFNWPSSEHAYHAQKLIHLMNKNPGDKGMQMIVLQTLRKIEVTKAGPGDEFLPHTDWDGPKGIVADLTNKYPRLFGADKRAFDALSDSNYHSLGAPNKGLMANGEPYTLKFMREVVKLKLEQHPELKKLAMDCARDGILPVEVASKDDNWASGPDGRGANMLGIAILELGNEYLRKEEPQNPPKIPNPKAYYQQLQQQASTQLRHDSLVSYTQNMQGWRQNVSPTSHQASTHGISKPTAPHSLGNPSPKQTAAKQTPLEYVRDRVNCAEVRVVPDKNNPSQKVVQLVFKNIQDASNFKALHSGSTTPQEGRVLTLGPTRAERLFEKLNIKEYGRKHPRPTMEALVDFAQPMQPKTTAPHSPSHTSSAQTLSKETPAEYVKRKLDSLHSGCNSIRVVPDAARPSQQVIQLVFDDAQKAAKFKAQYSGGTTPTSADGKTLTLGVNRAPQTFQNLGIEYYGRNHPRPTNQALIDDHQRKLGANNTSKPISPQSSRDTSFYAFGDKRLIIQNNAVVGYQYKNNGGSWQDSGDPSRFKRLTENFRELQQLKNTHYEHATHITENNRWYFCQASSDKFRDLKGDCLKTRLLLDFKSELTTYAQMCTSKEQFDKHVEELKQSKEYEVLATGQGQVTKIFGLETSSVKAFNNIAAELRDGIDDLSLDEKGPQLGF
ncbi:hypothetical protein [Legionella fallonii]|uniref:DrrA phosphatidylinositol 4-phosphate binding domain-containing protein n=1 Tax=Legionella fallonii LLAP-10 TaxID=1212491 RepID=A0A098G693_9GAMM|nr:hypothetical protein [Legionella fallonii]CEG58018.1 protein of unknown function [Legionella fallonii LLAP-10]